MKKDNMFSRYRRKESNYSIYCYPNSEIYINKFNCMDEKILKKIEADITEQALAELYLSPITGRFGIRHLQRIHHYIFHDIYSFAGKFREEDISKGNSNFCKCQFIKENLEDIFTLLQKEHLLSGLKKEEFIKKISFYMAEINSIHPFREGNGRAIREFVRVLGLTNGYLIEWAHVDGNKLLEAMIQSFNKDYSLLEVCIQESLSDE